MTRIVLVGAVIAALAIANPVVAGAIKSASVTTTFMVGADGRCYPVSTANWTGYQVNRIRHIFYRAGHSDQDYAWFSTTGFSNGESHNSGTMTSMAGVAAAPGEGWYVDVLFRSNGGAILAQATSIVADAPTTCSIP
jgi:hypothetical protein